MDIKDYAQMMSYLTRPRDVVPEPRPMAQVPRMGYYKGESVVKSHGQQIKELTEAGESSVSIAKKLGLKQQTVNGAMDAMDKGIAGKEFKLNKPRSEIIKLAVNETGVNLKDPKHLEEVIQWIDNNPNANQADAKKIFGRRKSELVDPKFYGSPGKKWDDEKAKLRNKVRLELTKERSSPSIESKMVAPKESGLNFHHAGFKESLTDLKNTMYIPGGSNRKMVKLFEDPLLKEMEAFTKVFDDVDASPLEKQKAATNYLKNDRSLRKKYPQFKDFKTRLSFRRTALDPSGIMVKEKLPDPSLAISQEPGMTLKGETPSTPKGKQILEFGKNNLQKLAAIGCPGKAMGGRIGFFEGQNLNKCALEGIEKLKGDPGKLTGGDQRNLRAISKSAKAARLLKNVLGPAAILGEVLVEGGIAANKFMSEGVPIKQALGQSYLNYLLGPKTKIDVEAERAKEFAKGEDFAMAERGRRMALFMAQSKEADAQRLKKREQQMEEALPAYDPNKQQYTDQNINEYLKSIGQRELLPGEGTKVRMNIPQLGLFGTQDKFMEGGIASLNVKK
jgi:hypothetical protein